MLLMVARCCHFALLAFDRNIQIASSVTLQGYVTKTPKLVFLANQPFLDGFFRHAEPLRKLLGVRMRCNKLCPGTTIQHQHVTSMLSQQLIELFW